MLSSWWDYGLGNLYDILLSNDGCGEYCRLGRLSWTDQFLVDLFAALVVGLGHVEQHEQEPGSRERGERTPQQHGVRLDEDLERFHDDERQGPGKRRGQGLYAAAVQSR